MLLITSGAGGGGFFQEEVEEFVGDCEVGLLLELLQGHQAEQGLEEGERCADVVEYRVRYGCCVALLREPVLLPGWRGVKAMLHGGLRISWPFSEDQ